MATKRFRLVPCACAAAAVVLAVTGAGAAPAARQAAPASAIGGRRLALTIGNNSYSHSPLKNAVNDAQEVGRVLEGLGFDVTVVADADYKKMGVAIAEFTDKLRGDDVGLFYFSGHGVQVQGENYLVPVDFNSQNEADLKFQTYVADWVHERMKAARIRILILDACRDNPFRSTRSGARGLAKMDESMGSIIAFATDVGRTASDNPNGKNGLFTQYLLEMLREPGLSVVQMFKRTRAAVFEASAGQQFPWVADGLIGDFYFRAPVTEKTTLTVTVDAPGRLTVDGEFVADMKAGSAEHVTVSASEPHLVRAVSGEAPVSVQQIASGRAGGDQPVSLLLADRVRSSRLSDSVQAARGDADTAKSGGTARPIATPAAAADPKAGVLQALAEYRAAYENMDIAALRRVYPAFTAFDDLQKRFADLQSIAVAMGNPQVTVLPDGTASASCVYSMTYTARTGKNDSTKPTRAEFQLRKVGATWIIQSLVYR